MAVADDVLKWLKRAGRPMTDAELAKALGKPHQQVNQAARKLADQRKTIRQKGPDGVIVNMLNKRANRRDARRMATEADRKRRDTAAGGRITEDQVKQTVKEHLERQGYRVLVAWGRERGIDIEATKTGSRWVIEAKAEVGKSGAQQVNYFLGALGELIQRMDDPSAGYGLALPDNNQYRGLVQRLPDLARERLDLTVFWVRRSGRGFTVQPDPGSRG